MHYHDFLLHLAAGPQGAWAVHLVRSLAGEADGPFEIPVTPEELRRLAEALARTAEASRAGRGAALLDVPPAPSLSDLGDRLFRALFPPTIRSRFDESLGKLGPTDGLRINLQIGLGNPAWEPLHALPWECLYQAPAGAFLACSRRTPVVRHLALPIPGARPPVAPPLRVLAVAAEPTDLPDLGLAAELAALKKLGRGIQTTPLPRADLTALRAALLARDVHVLHFLGHGGHAAAGQGVLYFTGNDGRSKEVGADQLASLLRDVTSLRLVVLNACQTGQTGAAGALASVAGQLLQAGVPAVVAMQFQVSDRAAIAFSQTFYRRLAEGDLVEAAVTEGRLAIVDQLRGSSEWITPVLFLRAPEGRLVVPGRGRKLRAVAVVVTGVALLVGAIYLRQLWMPGEEETRAANGTSEEAGQVPEPTPPADLDERSRGAAPQEGSASQPENRLGPAPPSPDPAVRDEPAPRTPHPAPLPRHYVLPSGAPVYLAEIRTHVTADFLAQDGEEFVRLTLAPNDGDVVLRSVFGPGTVSYESRGGRRSIQVLSVDFAGRTVTVRPGSS